MATLQWLDGRDPLGRIGFDSGLGATTETEGGARCSRHSANYSWRNDHPVEQFRFKRS